MQFNSLQFIIFLPVVCILYFSIPYRFRWILLLLASYYFYMCWKVEYIILIIASTLIDYFAGLMMGRTSNKAARKKYLIFSLCANLGLLFAFKYFNFFSESFKIISQNFNITSQFPHLNVLLPVGISFYTFQSLSYAIDVYRGVRKPEKHLGIFALYVAFFPQLVAGPIERSTRLLPQFFEKHDFDYDRAKKGILLILWGFFKKIVVADRLAVLVNQIYNNPTDYTGMPFVIATFFFAFQIYCDFSAYSDIAIGSARIMGYELMKNFNVPYISKSVGEFWSRWHISLSTWFKDYLYIPLGGNKVKKGRWRFNIMAVFLISGLWHGASWTFVIWGALHGFYMLFGSLTRNVRAEFCDRIGLTRWPFLHDILKTITTFCLVLVAWIFFRANSLSDAVYIISHIFKGLAWRFSIYNMGLSKSEAFLGFKFIIFIEIVHVLQSRFSLTDFVAKRHIAIRWSIYILFIMAIEYWGMFGSDAQFIYYQF